MSAPVLQACGVHKRLHRGGGIFGRGRGEVEALVDFDLALHAGACTALVGPSGAGKTTAVRCLLRLLVPDAGRVLLEGVDITDLAPSQLRPLRPRLQAVLQDPGAGLSPHLTVARLLVEPMLVHRVVSEPAAAARVVSLLEEVGLDPGLARRRPAQLSGGQRQRVAIARALALEPRVLICDEPTSALDSDTQARVLELLTRLRRERGLALLLVSHDLGAVRSAAEQVVVMDAGRVVERGSVSEIFASPASATGQALVAAER